MGSEMCIRDSLGSCAGRLGSAYACGGCYALDDGYISDEGEADAELDVDWSGGYADGLAPAPRGGRAAGGGASLGGAPQLPSVAEVANSCSASACASTCPTPPPPDAESTAYEPFSPHQPFARTASPLGVGAGGEQARHRSRLHDTSLPRPPLVVEPQGDDARHLDDGAQGDAEHEDTDVTLDDSDCAAPYVPFTPPSARSNATWSSPARDDPPAGAAAAAAGAAGGEPSPLRPLTMAAAGSREMSCARVATGEAPSSRSAGLHSSAGSAPCLSDHRSLSPPHSPNAASDEAASSATGLCAHALPTDGPPPRANAHRRAPRACAGAASPVISPASVPGASGAGAARAPASPGDVDASSEARIDAERLRLHEQRAALNERRAQRQARTNPNR